MDTLSAEYVSDHDAVQTDDTGRVFCPFCRGAFSERDMETYCEAGTKRSLEICTRCREDYEQDLNEPFETDVLAAATFSHLWNDVAKSQGREEGLTEQSAEIIARALGGEAWQGGGGIWLILIKRPDGRLVVISEDAVCEYGSSDAFEEGDFPACVGYRDVIFWSR